MFCEKRGENPEKPFTGKFVVRIPQDLHRKVYIAAKKSGSSLNAGSCTPWRNQRNTFLKFVES
jgi:predicted HicB family RNase H-like nuclease